jgi:hypothetical protein
MNEQSQGYAPCFHITFPIGYEDLRATPHIKLNLKKKPPFDGFSFL